jgi:hypothetical protein
MCEALTCIFTPCGRKTTEGTTDLCFEHQDFYTQDQWIRRHITHPKRGNYVLLGHQKGSVMRNLEDHIRHATKERVIVSEETIRSLAAVEKYVDVYRLLCENEYVDPLWNKDLFNLSITSFLKRRKAVFSGFWPQVHSYFHSYLTNSNFGPTLFFFHFLRILVKMKKQAEIHAYYQDIEYDAIIHEFFAPEDEQLLQSLFDDCCLCSKEYLALAARCKDPKTQEFFFTVIYPYFQAQKKKIRQERKEKGDDLKREIVENVYHPRNVERWLNTGGWELWEMMC